MMMAPRLVALLRLFIVAEVAAGLDIGWALDDAALSRFTKRCGHSRTMIDLCQTDSDIAPAIAAHFGFSDRDAAGQKEAIEAAVQIFPDLHCLARYLMSGKIRTDSEISPQYACQCVPCSAAESTRQQEGLDYFKVQATLIAAYPKSESYVECEDQDFYDDWLVKAQDEEEDYWLEAGDSAPRPRALPAMVSRQSNLSRLSIG